MRKIDYSDLRWNGSEYEIYAGYPLGHVSLNAEIDNLEQYREITSGISLDRLREICDAEREGRLVVLPCKAVVSVKPYFSPVKKPKSRLERSRAMAVVRTRVCDRCGKTIKYGKFPYSITETHKQITILGFGPYDYLHSKYELCRECSEKYDDFMQGKEQSDEM